MQELSEGAVVALIEEILTRACESSAPEVADATAGRVWLCACVGSGDAPVWEIVQLANAVLCWRRLPEGGSELHASEIRETGAHVDPRAVLEWLQGGRDTLVGEDECDDVELLEHVRTTIRGRLAAG